MGTSDVSVTSRQFLTAIDLRKGDRVQLTMPVTVSVWGVDKVYDLDGNLHVVVDWYLPRVEPDEQKAVMAADRGVWVIREEDDDQ